MPGHWIATMSARGRLRDPCAFDAVDALEGPPPPWFEHLKTLKDHPKLCNSISKILQHRRDEGASATHRSDFTAALKGTSPFVTPGVASGEDPLVCLFQERLEVYKRKKFEEVAQKLEQESRSRATLGDEAPAGTPDTHVAREHKVDGHVCEESDSCPEPAPLPQKLFPKGLNATASTSSKDEEGFNPRSPLKVKEQGSTGLSVIEDHLRNESAGAQVDLMERQVEDLNIALRSTSDQLHCCQIANSELKKRLKESESIVQGLGSKYSSLLKEVILAKELLCHVRRKLDGESGSISDTLRLLNKTSEKASHRIQAIDDLRNYPQEEVVAGFAEEVEKIATTLKKLRPPLEQRRG